MGINHVAFDEASNAADWSGSWQALDQGGSPLGIYGDGWTITVKISPLPAGSSPLLTATTADGSVAVSASDVITWEFTSEQMATLAPGTYQTGCLAAKAGEPTVQLFLGRLPIIQGL